MLTECFFLCVCSEITNSFLFPKQSCQSLSVPILVVSLSRSFPISDPSSFHAVAAPFSHSCLPPPSISDTFCVTPNKDVTSCCRGSPPMPNAVLSRADLPQFVSLRTTVSSFHSASRRCLRHLPSPKRTFHVHTWQKGRAVLTTASGVYLK